jgi:hypothetical protein
MAQNRITLDVTDQQYAEVDAALTTIENHLAGLTDLTQSERRGLLKMGDKSEAFCRQTLVVLAQNPSVVPPGLSLADAQDDLHHLSNCAFAAHACASCWGAWTTPRSHWAVM